MFIYVYSTHDERNNSGIKHNEQTAPYKYTYIDHKSLN